MQIMQRTKDNAKVKFAPYPNGGNYINIMAFSTMAYSTSGKLRLNENLTKNFFLPMVAIPNFIACVLPRPDLATRTVTGQPSKVFTSEEWTAI